MTDTADTAEAKPPAMSKEEKNKLKMILNDTISLLCKNAMSGKFEKDYIVSSVIGRLNFTMFSSFDLGTFYCYFL